MADLVLALTTPLMVDAVGETRIAEAQNLLAVNRFENFHPRDEGSPIGTFGEDTAAACHRAKYWLGWPEGQSTGTFGANLERFLTTGKLPRTYWLRRQMRRRRQRQARKLKALHTAQDQIGKKESPPGSNRVLYSEWYGMIGSWCAMFVTWCCVGAGIAGFLRGHRFAYCPYIDAAAASHQYGLSFIPASAVEPGDIVTYDFERDGTSDHVGFFEKWKVRGQSFWAIEGNTDDGGGSNGGEVLRRERSVSLVHHFIRVDG